MKTPRHALRPPNPGPGSRAAPNGQLCVGRASLLQLLHRPLIDCMANAEWLSLDCFPHASPILPPPSGKQKFRGILPRNRLSPLGKVGAGEGIRTLDPDLGKVVLYP